MMPFLPDVIFTAGVGVDGKQHLFRTSIIGREPVIFNNIIGNDNEIDKLVFSSGDRPSNIL